MQNLNIANNFGLWWKPYISYIFPMYYNYVECGVFLTKQWDKFLIYVNKFGE